ncbi:hypothetical protein LTR66_011426 [Elasticomyces elasticus]|nr:hypothetical protein LTR66_011426 [Elasticomyces elasticus]
MSSPEPEPKSRQTPESLQVPSTTADSSSTELLGSGVSQVPSSTTSVSSQEQAPKQAGDLPAQDEEFSRSAAAETLMVEANLQEVGGENVQRTHEAVEKPSERHRSDRRKGGKKHNSDEEASSADSSESDSSASESWDKDRGTSRHSRNQKRRDSSGGRNSSRVRVRSRIRARSRSRTSSKSRSRSGSRVSVDRGVRKKEKLKKRLAKAPKRAHQIGKYLQLMETRMAYLEGKLGSFDKGRMEVMNDDDRSSPYPPPPPLVTGETSATSTLTPIPKLHKISPEELKKRDFSREKPHYSIDVVMAEGWSSEDRDSKGDPWGGLQGPNEETSSSHRQGTRQKLHPMDKEPVKFIQINSEALQHLLEKHTCNGDVADCPYVIYAPFKSLVYHEEALRTHLKTLEAKWPDVAGDGNSGEIANNKSTSTQGQSESEAHASAEVQQDDTEVSAAPPTAETVTSPTEQDAKKEEVPSQAGKRADSFPSSRLTIHNEKAEQADSGELTPAKKKEALKGPDSLEAYLALKCLLDFFELYVKPRWNYFRSSAPRAVRYGDLWQVLQPGDDVIIEKGSPQRLWRVLRVTGGRPYLHKLLNGDPNAKSEETEKTEKLRGADDETEEAGHWSVFDLDCFYVDYNGKEFGPVHRDFRIPFYKGKKTVTSLEVYPLRLVEDAEKRRKALVENGRRFLELSNVVLRYYDGRTLVETPSGHSLTKEIKTSADADLTLTSSRPTRSEDVDSQVMIDFDRTFQYNPDWAPNLGIGDLVAEDKFEVDRKNAGIEECGLKSVNWWENIDYWDLEATTAYRAKNEFLKKANGERVTDRSKFTDQDLVLLPDRVFGFVLRTRSWACLAMREDKLRNVSKQDSGWDELQLPDGHRKMVESLVERHFRNKENSLQHPEESLDFDFVQGKGKGLILLLHGAPGVGKTSTAESVASKYQKPLLPITCGNLGLTAESVEEALTKNFQLAQGWDCILLLDEADVFLAQREKQDLKRNALVSVFLRTLEYYTGILFLTTNRIGHFDEAFRSRIHMSLLYPDLNRQQTEAIWKTNMARLLTHKEKHGQKLVVEDNGGYILAFALNLYDHYTNHKRPPWNGRQIRNAFQTAVALAEFEAKDSLPHLRWQHFQTVAIASDEFDEYLRKTRGGMYEVEIMAEAGLRAKNYAPAAVDHGWLGNIPQQRTSQERSSSIAQLTPFATFPSKQGVADLNPFAPLARTPNQGYQQNTQGFGGQPGTLLSQPVYTNPFEGTQASQQMRGGYVQPNQPPQQYLAPQQQVQQPPQQFYAQGAQQPFGYQQPLQQSSQAQALQYNSLSQSPPQQQQQQHLQHGYLSPQPDGTNAGFVGGGGGSSSQQGASIPQTGYPIASQQQAPLQVQPSYPGPPQQQAPPSIQHQSPFPQQTPPPVQQQPQQPTQVPPPFLSTPQHLYQTQNQDQAVAGAASSPNAAYPTPDGTPNQFGAGGGAVLSGMGFKGA